MADTKLLDARGTHGTRARQVLLICAAAAQFVPALGMAQDAVGLAVRERLEELRTRGLVSIEGEIVRASGPLVELYAGAGSSALWTAEAALTDLERAIREVGADGLDPTNYHWAAIQQRIRQTRSPSE